MAKTKIRPLDDRVVVEPIEAEETTAGGIVLPDSAKEKPAEGIVISTGPGKVAENGKVIALDVKKGDQVLFSKYSGTEVNIDGNDYLLMREDEILGVLETGKKKSAKKK